MPGSHLIQKILKRGTIKGLYSAPGPIATYGYNILDGGRSYWIVNPNMSINSMIPKVAEQVNMEHSRLMEAILNAPSHL